MKNLSVAFILITILLDAIGIGLIFPVMPDLIREVRGTNISGAALWGGALSAIFAVMQFIFSPTIGSLSDRFGRRPVLLVSLGVMALDYVLMAVAGTVWLLVIGRVLGGITAATFSTAAAFMADISVREEKSRRFGLISAAFGVGFVLGPVLGGLLAEFGPRTPFWVAAALAAANLVFGLLVLPETVTKANRRPFRLARANPVGALKHIGSVSGVTALLGVYFFYQLSNTVYPAVWAYFTTAAFGWDPGMIGLSLGVYGISTAVVQAGLIGPVIARFGERRTVYFGLLFSAGVLLCIGFVTSGYLLLALTPLAALGGIVAPALQGIMSGRAADDQQGELQGLLSSINAVAMIVTPLMMTAIFAYFTAEGAPVFLPGAPFLLAMLLMVVSWMIYSSSLRNPSGAPDPKA